MQLLRAGSITCWISCPVQMIGRKGERLLYRQHLEADGEVCSGWPASTTLRESSPNKKVLPILRSGKQRGSRFAIRTIRNGRAVKSCSSGSVAAILMCYQIGMRVLRRARRCEEAVWRRTGGFCNLCY
jgi:hypothetical protein